MASLKKRSKFMRDLLRNFPIKSAALQMEAVGADICPSCGSDLDRGKNCDTCRSAWAPRVPARYRWVPPTGQRHDG